MYRHILIATDGSELAHKGVAHGLALAARLQARVTALTVSEPIVTGFDDALGWGALGAAASEFEVAREQAAKKILDAVEAEARQAGVAVQAKHVSGRYAAEAIAHVAEAEGCDLVVMASHGRRGLGRLLVGSQTQEVLTHSRIPVLVIR